MAYEVARVHGLIMSNIQDGGDIPAAAAAVADGGRSAWHLKKGGNSEMMMPPRRASPDSPFLHDFAHHWSESSLSSPESSTEASETESDDEDGHVAGLAEQIAHSMLDDDEPLASAAATAKDGNAPDASVDSRLVPGGRVNAVSPKVAVSPQSNWSPHSGSSAPASWSDSVSSSKQSSQVSSPPSTPSTSEGDAWDLLNAAAGEVVRIRMSEEKQQQQQGSFPTPVAAAAAVAVAAHDAALQCSQVAAVPQMPSNWRSSVSPAAPAVQAPSPTGCTAGGARLTAPAPVSKYGCPGERLPAMKSWSRPKDESRVACNVGLVQQRAPRGEGASWNHRQKRPAHHHKANGATQKAAGRQQSHSFSGGQQQPQHHHHHQQQHHHPRVAGRATDGIGAPPQRTGAQVVNGGSGMRAVFLGAAGSGRESSGGTGVFLPRSIGGGSEQRRKPACSTVLLPSRIVQVLNLNVDDMRGHPAAPLSMAATHNRGDLSGALRTPPPPQHMYMMDLSSGVPKFGDAALSSFQTRKVPGPRVRPSEPVELSLPTEWTY